MIFQTNHWFNSSWGMLVAECMDDGAHHIHVWLRAEHRKEDVNGFVCENPLRYAQLAKNVGPQAALKSTLTATQCARRFQNFTVSPIVQDGDGFPGGIIVGGCQYLRNQLVRAARVAP